MTYIFFLGNSPDLAAAEISSVLTRQKKLGETKRVGHNLFFSTEMELSEEFFSLLGGTIKVSVIFSEVPKKDNNTLIIKVAEHLESLALKNNLNKISFGLSQYCPLSETIDSVVVTKKIKNEVNPQFKVRFVLPKFPDQQLSSVVIKKQLLIDICVVAGADNLSLSQTIWVQDFEDWGKRDYGRPAVEGHIGMLPPKVARMMLNLALPQISSDQVTIVDPFCGVGTVLAESLILGVNAIGSDLDKQQVQRTRTNLKWLSEAYALPPEKYQLFEADAPNLGKILKKPVDAIVTEPDLGPNSLSLNANLSPEISKKLEGLYLACLKNWKNLLLPGGKIVIALPSFSSSGNISKDNNQYLVKTVVDKAKIMGYSISQSPFVYARPQAKVIRNICIFTSN